MAGLKNRVWHFIKGRSYDYSAPYDSAEGVELLDSWYNPWKQRAFFGYIRRRGRPFGGITLEPAGGFYGKIIEDNKGYQVKVNILNQ